VLPHTLGYDQRIEEPGVDVCFTVFRLRPDQDVAVDQVVGNAAKLVISGRLSFGGAGLL